MSHERDKQGWGITQAEATGFDVNVPLIPEPDIQPGVTMYEQFTADLDHFREKLGELRALFTKYSTAAGVDQSKKAEYEAKGLNAEVVQAMIRQFAVFEGMTDEALAIRYAKATSQLYPSDLSQHFELPESNFRRARSRQTDETPKQQLTPDALEALLHDILVKSREWFIECALTPKQVILPNPATYMPAEDSGRRVRSFGSAAEVKVNEETGDLGFFIPDEENVEFISLRPAVRRDGQGVPYLVLVLTERDLDTDQVESTLIRIREEEEQSAEPEKQSLQERYPDKHVRQYRSRSHSERSKPVKKKWIMDVTCQTGSVHTYAFGETDLKVQKKGISRKPIIILLPEDEISATVKLDFDGAITEEYPLSNKGTWNVDVAKNGTITIGDREFPSLFWEGITHQPYSDQFTEGFCVARSEVISFLEEKLTILGMPDRYQADFITYWAPIMRANDFSVVRFLQEEYTDKAKLTVTPKPDSELRVFMVFKSVPKQLELPPQQLETTELTGFKLIEWGGCDLDEVIGTGRVPRTL